MSVIAGSKSAVPPASRVRDDAADPAGAAEYGALVSADSDAGRAPPRIPSGCSNMRLRRLTRLVSRHYDAHLALCGLKTTQYSLLAVVADQGPLQQGDLARLLSLDASTLTRNLRPLVDAGLLAVEAGSDARSRQVCVTPAGRERRALARRHWKRAQLDFNDIVGTERAASLHEVVDTCYRMLVDCDDRRTK